MVNHLAFTSRYPKIRYVVTLFLLAVFFLPNHCFAANYNYTYDLFDLSDGSKNYQLTVSVTSSLYEYYRSRDHNIYSYDFAKFVTPYSLKPIADDLWSIYDDEEDFANGALMIVHQIPYMESGPQKYPVETIVENEGDCDLFSFIAASIMKAGGLDVVLLFYQTESHMNVGVSLSDEPKDARADVSYFTYDGKRYYIAECTGDDWRNGWRVGECPDLFREAQANIITLENCEKLSPGQVSSSYSILDNSYLYLTVSTRFAITGGAVTISGSISPALSGKNVTFYVSSSGSSLRLLAYVTTDSEGRYSYTWRPSSVGISSIRASWSGDANYAGADSSIHTLIIVPLAWLMIGVMVIILLIVLLVVSLAMRRKPAEEPVAFEGLEVDDYQEYF